MRTELEKNPQTSKEGKKKPFYYKHYWKDLTRLNKPKVEANTKTVYTEITSVYILDLNVIMKEEWEI